MSLRPRRGSWKWLLEKRDDSDCDDESDSCSSSTTSTPIASTTTTTSQSTPSQSSPAVDPGGAMPPPPPTDGPVPPSGGPKPPKPPKQTSTSSTFSTPSVTSLTSSSTRLSKTKPVTSSQTQSSLFASGIGTLPTTVPTPPQKQPAPSLTSAVPGISSINESSATAIKAASAIIAVEATVIIAVLLLICYKLYIRKRQKQTLNGVKWAIGRTTQMHTPPYNDKNAGPGIPPPVPPSAVLWNGSGVWMGPGVIQTSVFSLQNGHQAQVQAPYMKQLRGELPLDSNPRTFPAASHNLENPFLALNEKALPEIQVHDMREPIELGVSEIHAQASPLHTPHEADRQAVLDVGGEHEGISSRGETELLEMERELEDLERERARHGR